MLARILLAFLIAIAGFCCAQESKPASWQDLIQAGKCESARKLCVEWIASNDSAKVIDAHKSLANVALCGDSHVIAIQANDQGGGFVASTFKPEAVDEALGQLNEALKLAPQDISIHRGRLHVLEVSFRYSEMTKALDESCTIYKGPEGVQPWLAYTSELFEQKQFRASLALLEVLNKHFPGSHEVLGNIGTMHMALKEDNQAIRYLRQAIDLAPKDPIDAWNLGRLYDYDGETGLADQWYQRSLTLESDDVQRRSNFCFYARFVEGKLHDRSRACELQRVNCPETERSACSASK